MTTHSDLSGAFVWTKSLPPLPPDDFYDEWENEQRDRWAKEDGDEYERIRKEEGTHDFLGIVFLLLGVAFVCVAMLIGAR